MTGPCPGRRRRTLLLLGVALLVATGWAAWKWAVAPATVTALVVGAREPVQPLTNSDLPLTEACRAVSVAFPPPQPRVVVLKQERRLELLSGSVRIKQYSIGLGRVPQGDKEREGDGRTPTGDFFVCTRLRRSRWHRFLGISYPAPEDARRGLTQGIINAAESQAILRAHRRGQQPPWKTLLGGEIGLHGGGSGADWTAGCVALENEAVAELFPHLPLGTPVRIVE